VAVAIIIYRYTSVFIDIHRYEYVTIYSVACLPSPSTHRHLLGRLPSIAIHRYASVSAFSCIHFTLFHLHSSTSLRVHLPYMSRRKRRQRIRDSASENERETETAHQRGMCCSTLEVDSASENERERARNGERNRERESARERARQRDQ